MNVHIQLWCVFLKSFYLSINIAYAHFYIIIQLVIANGFVCIYLYLKIVYFEAAKLPLKFSNYHQSTTERNNRETFTKYS